MKDLQSILTLTYDMSSQLLAELIQNQWFWENTAGAERASWIVNVHDIDATSQLSLEGADDPNAQWNTLTTVSTSSTMPAEQVVTLGWDS